MRGGKNLIRFLGAAVLSLALWGCSGETAPPAGDLAIEASFQQEDGGTLPGGTVRFSCEGTGAERPLDGDGRTKISGLPRTGDLELTVWDRQEKARGSMTLSLSEGSITDAATDSGGVGHVTLRRDMEEVALVFTLREDGALRCSLWAAQSD